MLRSGIRTLRAGIFELLFLCVLLWAPSAWTQYSPVPDCQKWLRALVQPGHDSSIEIELGASTQALSLFTTTDGTVGPVLGGAELPEKIAQQIFDAYPEYKSNPAQIPWDALDAGTHIELIQHAARTNNLNFWESRSVPGLVPRKTIQLRFTKTTEFLGKTYPAGTHNFDTDTFLGSYPIQFMGPDNMKSNLGFEIHFRTSFSSGKNLDYAWKFMDAAKLARSSVHQHVVAAVPLAIRLNTDKAHFEALRIAEYYRRINLYTEMEAMLNGHPISMNKKETYTNFGNLKTPNLINVYRYFAKGASETMGSENKIAWVGIRGSDAYDDKGLWGLEFRDLSPRYKTERLTRILDASQAAIEETSYGIPPEKLSRWALQHQSKSKLRLMAEKILGFFHIKLKTPSTFKEGDFTRLIADTKYKDDQASYQDLPTSMKRLLNFNEAEEKKFNQVFAEKHEYNLAINLLIKDWSSDPLFFETPEMVARIERVQAQALRRFVGGESQIEVMKYFLKRSGIHYTIEKSLGI